MTNEKRLDDLLKAAQRVVAVDAAHGLPHEDTSFEAFNEWVAALYALKEAVERAGQTGRRNG